MIDRYTLPEMARIWQEQNKFNCFLQVELASLQALQEYGTIPNADFLLIQKNARFTLSEIKELEESTKHDVIAFTRVVSRYLGEEKKWFHYGLTSTDVVDTANSLLLYQANQLLEDAMNDFLATLAVKAKTYQETPCIGRTHGMHAEVTCFGLKWVLWWDEGKRIYRQFQAARKQLEQVKLSGAVGNFSVLPPEIEERVAEILGLKIAPISTQVLSRDRHASYIFCLAQFAQLIEKVGLEIRHLSRSEVGEVREAFAAGQKGSSAMPHKQNPIASENMSGCARIIRSYVEVAMENNLLWHERDISHSSAERIILPDATILLYYMLKRYKKVVDDLVVDTDRMLANIHSSHQTVFSGQVLAALINKGVSREAAYDWIQILTFQAHQENQSLETILMANKDRYHFTAEEVKACFEIKPYLKNVKKIMERVGIE
ncbi:MAG: adenylosuccinate lyase [Bacilli bacterium]|jgi:adenylosuccinate lyase|nr:adenylosuccinate lyase [Bacilli bacterium]MDY0063626.1 adenylosuccinate lyase [Bacilli bacterium]